jgi:hypothetical protein
MTKIEKIPSPTLAEAVSAKPAVNTRAVAAALSAAFERHRTERP